MKLVLHSIMIFILKRYLLGSFPIWKVLTAFIILGSCNSPVNEPVGLKPLLPEANETRKLPEFENVVIGDQVWMAENLNLPTFRNGDSIKEVKTDLEWKLAFDDEKPAWCYYGNDSLNGSKYGRLYNWFAVIDSRGLAPGGWRIPSDYDWTVLWRFLKAECADKFCHSNYAGIDLKSIDGWADGGNGTNVSEFSALPGGCRNYGGLFFNLNKGGYWWMNGSPNYYNARCCSLSSANQLFVIETQNLEGKGFSIRCIKN